MYMYIHVAQKNVNHAHYIVIYIRYDGYRVWPCAGLKIKAASVTSLLKTCCHDTRMGQRSSSHNNADDFVDSPSVDAPAPSSIGFDPSESYMVGYGIDVQTSRKFSADMALSKITVRDAQHICDILVQSEMIPMSNTQLYSASENEELCSISGMKKTFQDCARKVGPNGLFVFHFSGHGVEMKVHRKKEWGLAPVDFDCTPKTYLTANVFSEWFSEAECKAKHILFFLDCCHAGGLGTKLGQFSNLPVKGNVYILSACTANEETLVTAALKHSIFTYFLSHAILKLCKVAGEFPLEAVFNECHNCSKAFSSLMIMYDTDGQKVKIKSMRPQISVINPKSVELGEVVLSKGDSRVQSDGEINRFQYAMELYDRNKPCSWLDEVTISQINWWVLPKGALYELNKRQFLSGRVLEAAVCSMMYSIATIELACDVSHEKVINPNLSIIAFLQVVAALDTFVEDLEIPQTIFFMAWMFYREVLRSNRVSMREFCHIFKKLRNNRSFCPEHRMRSATIVPGYKPAQKSKETSSTSGATTTNASRVCKSVHVVNSM